MILMSVFITFEKWWIKYLSPDYSLHYVTTAWAKSGAATWNALSGRHNDSTAEDTRTRQTGRKARQREADSRDSSKHTLNLPCEDTERIYEGPQCPLLSKEYKEWRKRKKLYISFKLAKKNSDMYFKNVIFRC